MMNFVFVIVRSTEQLDKLSVEKNMENITGFIKTRDSLIKTISYLHQTVFDPGRL